MKNGEKLTPLTVMTMAERTENYQRVSLELLSERMKNKEWRENDAPPSHNNGGQKREILENFFSISLGENEE